VTLFYLVRHAEPEVIDGDFFGSGLSKRGIDATYSLARSGTIPRPDALYTSPFRRARETAAVFGDVFDLSPVSEAFLAEWNLQTQNLPGPEYVEQEATGWSDFDAIVRGNESLNQLRQRAEAGLRALAQRDGSATLLLVSHGTLIDVVSASLAGRTPSLADIHSMRHLDYAIVEHGGGRLQVLKDIVEPAR
jgi:2,3-bisphosphoglycerate-dependent phosphoglycerate mutase